MSAAKRQNEESNARRRQHRGRGTVQADWTSVDAEAIKAAIGSLTASGGAIRFGYTRDGGAYAVGILGDGEPYTDYLRPSDDVEGYLQELAEDFRPQGKVLDITGGSVKP